MNGGRVVLASEVDLRVVDPGEWGSLLQHFTGSKAHNVALRERARDLGLSLSEHGFAPVDGGAPEPCRREEDVYARLGLDWIPPELREDQGEIAAAAAGALPKLVRLQDLKGDLHGHSDASDGRSTPTEIPTRGPQRTSPTWPPWSATPATTPWPSTRDTR